MTTPAHPAPEIAEVVAFLNGSGPLDGLWFGEKHPSGNAFWWRKHLAAVAHPSPATGEAVAWRYVYFDKNGSETIHFARRKEPQLWIEYWQAEEQPLYAAPPTASAPSVPEIPDNLFDNLEAATGQPARAWTEIERQKLKEAMQILLDRETLTKQAPSASGQVPEEVRQALERTDADRKVAGNTFCDPGRVRTMFMRTADFDVIRAYLAPTEPTEKGEG